MHRSGPRLPEAGHHDRRRVARGRSVAGSRRGDAALVTGGGSGIGLGAAQATCRRRRARHHRGSHRGTARPKRSPRSPRVGAGRDRAVRGVRRHRRGRRRAAVAAPQPNRPAASTSCSRARAVRCTSARSPTPNSNALEGDARPQRRRHVPVDQARRGAHGRGRRRVDHRDVVDRGRTRRTGS